MANQCLVSIQSPPFLYLDFTLFYPICAAFVKAAFQLTTEFIPFATVFHRADFLVL